MPEFSSAFDCSFDGFFICTPVKTSPSSVTARAVNQLLLIADAYNIPHDAVVFKIEAKSRFPAGLVWHITPDTSADARFDVRKISGLTFAVERTGSIYLTEVEIDFVTSLVKNGKVYNQSSAEVVKPVWPKGFVFNGQKPVLKG